MSSANPEPDQSGLDLPSAGRLDRPTAIRLIEEADALAGQGEYEAAGARYRRVVGHSDPDVHVAALLGLGEAQYRQDDEPGALQAWIAAAQAPETPLSWLAWKQLAGARVREGNLVGAMRAYREAERRAPLAERAEIAGRLGWLSKETGDQRSAQTHFSRARAGGVGTPIVTWAILAVTVAIGLSEILSPAGEVFLELFALDKSAVAQGELYRLVTVVLVHSPTFILHLAGNMYALYLVGPFVEALYGRAAFLLIYLLTAAAGSVASYLFTPNDSVGASGAIFGLFGCLFVALRVHRPAGVRNVRGLQSQIGMLIVFNLALGFGLGGFIDNAAHIGGLLAGVWLGLAIRPRGMATNSRLWQRPASAGGSSGAGGPEPRLRPPTELLVTALGIVGLLAVLAIGVATGTAAFAAGPSG